MQTTVVSELVSSELNSKKLRKLVAWFTGSFYDYVSLLYLFSPPLPVGFLA